MVLVNACLNNRQLTEEEYNLVTAKYDSIKTRREINERIQNAIYLDYSDGSVSNW